MATLYVAIYKADNDDIPHWCLYTIDDYGNEQIYESLGQHGIVIQISHQVSLDTKLRTGVSYRQSWTN